MPKLPTRPSLSQIRKQAKALSRLCLPQLILRRSERPSSSSPVSTDSTVGRTGKRRSPPNSTSTIPTRFGKSGFASRQCLTRRSIGLSNWPPEAVPSKKRYTNHFFYEVYEVTTRDEQHVVFKANWFNHPGKPQFEIEKLALTELERRSIPAPRNLFTEHELPGRPSKSVIVNTKEGRDNQRYDRQHAELPSSSMSFREINGSFLFMSVPLFTEKPSTHLSGYVA